MRDIPDNASGARESVVVSHQKDQFFTFPRKARILASVSHLSQEVTCKGHKAVNSSYHCHLQSRANLCQGN